MTNFLLFLIGATANIPVKLIGVLKVGEIIAMILVLCNPIKIINGLYYNKYFRIFTIFLLWYLILGSVSTYINGNGAIRFIKGFANIVVIFFSFAVFYILLKKDYNKVIYFLLGYGLFALIFSPYTYSLEEVSKFSENMNLEDVNFFDMYIAPVLTPLVLGLPFLLKNKIKVAVLIALIYGLVALKFDAKSTGFVFIFPSIVYFIRASGIILSGWRIKTALLLSPLLIYGLVSGLTSLNLLGTHGSEQMEEYSKNLRGFNPFIYVGRPEPMVALFAVSTQPLYGHGFNKKDPGFVTLAKAAGLFPRNFYYRYKGIIPCHSILILSMLEGGIFASFVWFFVLYCVIKCFIIINKFKMNYFSFFIFTITFYLLWNIMFSGVLRLDIGYMIIIIFILLNNFRNNRLNVALQKS